MASVNYPQITRTVISNIKQEPPDWVTAIPFSQALVFEKPFTGIKQEPADSNYELSSVVSEQKKCPISGGNINSNSSRSLVDQQRAERRLQSPQLVESQTSDNAKVCSVEKRRRSKRVACTCSNCKEGENQSGRKKQHSCHIAGCNKIYRKTSHLRAHLRWHVGDHPFVCSWLFCGKSFTRSDKLRRHYLTHTGEKTYQCCECSKKFMRSDHLAKHIKTHYKSHLEFMDISSCAKENSDSEEVVSENAN